MLSNYPAGLNDNTPGAPWNDPIIPEKEFDVTCCQVLSKTVPVFTSNYTPGASGVDYEYDPEGSVAVGWQDPDDTSDTNWEEEYHNNDYHTPLQLIELFGQFLKQQLEQGVVFKSPRFTQSLIEECKDWIEDEIDYEEG